MLTRGGASCPYEMGENWHRRSYEQHRSLALPAQSLCQICLHQVSTHSSKTVSFCQLVLSVCQILSPSVRLSRILLLVVFSCRLPSISIGFCQLASFRHRLPASVRFHQLPSASVSFCQFPSADVSFCQLHPGSSNRQRPSEHLLGTSSPEVELPENCWGCT